MKKSRIRQSKVLKRNKRAILMSAMIVLCVVTLAFAPGIRLILLSHVPPSLSIFDTEKPILQSGNVSFTLGDLAFVVSLVAASFTIALFVQTVRKS